MIVKRKLFSVMDEEGNLGYYLYNEATGEEKLFSIVEEERDFASVRAMKKAAKTMLDKASKGKLTTGDVARMERLKGFRPSLKTIENPNYNKVVGGTYNKFNQVSKGNIGKAVSKSDFIKQVKEGDRLATTLRRNPRKGEMGQAVNNLNQIHRLVN